jgi:hypothetical protein
MNKSYDISTPVGSKLITSQSLIELNRFSRILNLAFHQSKKFRADYLNYFLLVLLSDVIKYEDSYFKSIILIKKRNINTVDTKSEVLNHSSIFDIIHMILSQMKSKEIYLPSILKIFDILKLFCKQYSDKVDVSNKIRDVLFDLYPIIKDNFIITKNSISLNAKYSCSLLNRNDGKSSISHFIIILTSFMKVLLYSINNMNANELNLNSPYPLYELLGDFVKTFDVLIEIVEILGAKSIMLWISENDQDLFTFLLQLEGIQSLLEKIIIKNDNKVNDTTESLIENCKLLILKMNLNNMNSEYLFILLFFFFLCEDGNLFIEFLCSPETDALQYFIRITKRFVNSPDLLISSCDKYSNHINNNNKNNIDILNSSKDSSIVSTNSNFAIIWVESEIKLNNTNEIIYRNENNQTANVKSIDKKEWDKLLDLENTNTIIENKDNNLLSDSSNTADITINKMINILTCILNTLIVYTKKNLFPCNSKILRERLHIIISYLNATQRKNSI